MGGNGRSVSFPTKGSSVSGEILELDMAQQRDFASGEPKTFEDGSPMLQLVVSLQTDLREDTEDDGMRKLYVKGQMQSAIRDAVRSSGSKKIEVGGTLKVRYSDDGEPSRKGFNPPKIYEAKYEPPSRGVAVDDLF
jgi:hypothetical protein